MANSIQVSSLLILSILFSSSIFRVTPESLDDCNEKRHCDSEVCVQAANHFLKSINSSVDPCDDFYEFTCGRQINDAKLRGTSHKMDIISKVMRETIVKLKETLMEEAKQDEPRTFQIMKQLYKSCLEDSNIEADSVNPLLEMIENLGGWPVLEKNSSNKMIRFDFYKTLYNFSAIRPYSIFFQYKKASDQYIILTPPKFGSYENSFDEAMKKKQFASQYTYMVNVVKLLGGDENTAIKDMKDVLELDIDLNKRLLARTNGRVLANYSMWQIVDKALGLYSTEELRSARMKYYRDYEENRWETCLSVFKFSELKHLLSAMFIKKYYTEEVQDKVRSIEKHIRTTIAESLVNLDIEEKAKQELVTSFLNSKTILEHDNFYLDDQMIDDEHEELTLDHDNFLSNFLAFEKFETAKFINYYPFVKPLDANVNTESISKRTGFPASFIVELFKGRQQPSYINYGSFGSILAHEIYHTLEGKRSDPKLYHKDFKECVIDQYFYYTVEGTSERVNGTITLNENVADITEFKAAYNAYEKWIQNEREEMSLPGFNYEPKQLFWMSIANIFCADSNYYYQNIDDHAPNKYRVNGALSNLQEFANDFRCPAESKMNPVRKCRLSRIDDK